MSRSRALGLCGVVLLLLALWPVTGHAAQEGTPLATPTGSSSAPVPVTFPRDDGPHDTTTEWWYYTGHLVTETGDRYGFEYVIFKGRRSGIEGYAAHFAITDNQTQTFRYDQRVGPASRRERSTEGFDLALGNWMMRGANGEDQLQAEMAGYAIDLQLSSLKPPVLHDGDGHFNYGDGTSSYYYSRTRIAVNGSLTVGNETLPVTGEAWMDHQWGDFASFTAGGWDWFAVQLADGTELMLYVIRNETGETVEAYGSLVDWAGVVTQLAGADFVVEPVATWTSPATGTTYPSGWTISLPAESLSLTLTPALVDQELDTTQSTGVIYWEGEVTVEGDRAGSPIDGLGYVELTGYAPYTPPSSP